MNRWAIIGRFLLILLLQVIIFNRFFFWGYLNPYVYVLLIIFLPTTLSRASVLLWAFAAGFTVDLFENSAGIHAAASVFLAYIRPVFFGYLSRGTDLNRESLRFREIAPLALSIYAFLSILIHHFALFLIESFTFREIGMILARTITSAGFTFLFVLMFQLIVFRRRNRL